MKTLNHIIIYNPGFSSVNNYYICSPCCMTSNVQMMALHLNMDYICNKFFFLLFPKPYKHPETSKLNLNTLWMKQNYKKTINIDYYYFLPSMNHSRFMEI